MLTTAQQFSDHDFNKAFEVFREEQIRCVRERATHISRERATQTRAQGISGNVDPYVGRFSAYQSLTKHIGDDFVTNVEKILIPNRGEISNQDIQTVTQELQRIFVAQLDHAKGAETRFAISIGRQNDAKSMILPVEGLFTSALSSYRAKVVSVIKQSNLNKARKPEKFVDETSLTDRFILRLKNRPVIAALLVVVAVVVGLGSFTNALRDVTSFLYSVLASRNSQVRCRLSVYTLLSSEEYSSA